MHHKTPQTTAATGAAAALITPPSPPPIPDHQLLAPIGQGAYGQVWLARNVLGTFRAVKIVYRRTFSDDRPYEREFAGIKHFEPVSRMHPGLVNVLHVGRSDPLGCFYYVMEVADDRTRGQDIELQHYWPKNLRSELAERKRLPAEECLTLAHSLVSALGFLHEHGLIHRDVKPSNVIFIRGQPKLADIGLVTDLSDEATAVGTDGYVPPEGPGSAAADLYSLGKLLYEISTGFDRTRFPSLPTRLHEFPDASLLARLNHVILRACEPKTRRRFRSAKEMESALEAAVRGEVVEAPNVPAHSVAVLPFVNMSPDQENEYLSDGITEDLTTALAQVKGLRVAGRSSAFSFKGKSCDARDVGERLGVRAIVEGSVRKSGQQLRITAQLIDAQDGCCLWSERYDRQMREVFELQDEISRAIVAALKVKLAPGEGELVRASTASTQAYQLYLQGRYEWTLRGGHLNKALHYFELALLEDPQYALAYTGVADCWNLFGFYTQMAPREAYPRAKAAALKAVQLDPNLAEAHNSLGLSYLMFDWDWRQATKEFARALEINPAYSPARYWQASFYSAAGRHAEAIAEDLRGIELDPLSAVMRAHMAWTYLHARKFERALEEARRALELDPQFILPHWVLGRALMETGDLAGAVPQFQKLLASPSLDSWGIAWIGYVSARSGRPEQAEQAIAQLGEIAQSRYVRPYWFALLQLSLGRLEECFVALQKCIDERDAWIGWLKCDPSFDSLQHDSRLQRLWPHLGL
jgi:TolB-like protein/Tfp pilus assembly protein PilF